jgi:alpha-ketoglutarate-dependent 2,4-dichlorophenoxyacetate dioxygenase
MAMRTTPLHDRFGIEVHGVDLCQVTATSGYPEIRAAFERHSLLLFRGQALDQAAQRRVAALFGPIEDRSRGVPGPRLEDALVTNLDERGALAPEGDLRLLNHQANQLWHTDSTFIPVPALANVLAAHVVPSTGGETEFVSTRAGWRDLPAAPKAAARGAVLRHRYAHSRAKISPALAAEEKFTRWADQAWRAVWPNPVTGEEALYIASHAYAVEGMAEDEGAAFIDDLIDRVTGPESIYAHAWRPGDVIVWDERATLHRGRPWPYEEERTLVSFIASAGEADGLAQVRP